MGQILAETLNNAIDRMDGERSDVIARMASEAGIDESTVGQILRGEIDCPPLDRLQGFARVLPITLSTIRGAAERDGCEYASNNSLWYVGQQG